MQGLNVGLGDYEINRGAAHLRQESGGTSSPAVPLLVFMLSKGRTVCQPREAQNSPETVLEGHAAGFFRVHSVWPVARGGLTTAKLFC